MILSLWIYCSDVAAGPTDSAHSWIAKGVYAEYSFHSGCIWFSNGTFFFPENVLTEAAFRWECVHVTESDCRVNATLWFSSQTQPFRRSVLLDIDTETRRVSLLNGTYVGMTFLWLPPDLKENQTLLMTDGVLGNVTMLSLVDSPQGLQEAAWVVGNGEVDGHTIAPNGGYDLSTGLLLQSTLWGEPTLLAMGILDPGVIGHTEFVATSVNLGAGIAGPEGPNVEPSGTLLTVIPIGIFALTLLAVFQRRMQQRREKAKKSRFRSIDQNYVRGSFASLKYVSPSSSIDP